jgi:hypothetical protein
LISIWIDTNKLTISFRSTSESNTSISRIRKSGINIIISPTSTNIGISENSTCRSLSFHNSIIIVPITSVVIKVIKMSVHFSRGTSNVTIIWSGNSAWRRLNISSFSDTDIRIRLSINT